jgi:hypothetical protein
MATSKLLSTQDQQLYPEKHYQNREHERAANLNGEDQTHQHGMHSQINSTQANYGAPGCGYQNSNRNRINIPSSRKNYKNKL